MESSGSIRSVLSRKGGQVHSVSPDSSVFDAVAKMAEKDIGALAVIDQGNLVGIFSERDYARKVILLGRSSRNMVVSEAMTQPAVCISPDATVDGCMRLMVSNRIRHLLVLERGDIVGIVSIGDLVNWIISAQADTIGHLQNYIAGSYPK